MPIPLTSPTRRARALAADINVFDIQIPTSSDFEAKLATAIREAQLQLLDAVQDSIAHNTYKGAIDRDALSDDLRLLRNDISF